MEAIDRMVKFKQILWVSFVFLVSVFYCFNVSADDLLGKSYTIGPGDILDVSVWKNNELTKLVPVLPDGYISFPLVGEIRAAGKTVSEFKKYLEDKLLPYMPEPSLSVIVKEVNIKIYVIGKVNRPGIFGLNTNINVLQALTMAGGLNPFAKRNEIKILRKIGNETKIYAFIYDDVADGKNLGQNIDVERGDVIVVP